MPCHGVDQCVGKSAEMHHICVELLAAEVIRGHERLLTMFVKTPLCHDVQIAHQRVGRKEGGGTGPVEA